MAEKTMTASRMTDGQIENTVAKFRDALRTKRKEFGSEAVQQALGINNLGMRLLEPFRVLVEAASDLIVRTVKVDRSLIGKAALDATGRKQYGNDEVVATMPQGEGEDVEVVFFKLSRYISDDDLENEYGLRGIVPVDPHTLAAFNAANSEFADDHPNSTHWKDADGKWYYVTFDRWYADERNVGVDRHDNEWHDVWWFAGRRK